MALLEVKGLSTWFHTRNGIVKAVNDVSFSVDEGETLAIVGESGSGKSVCCYGLLGLIPMPPGKIESGTAHFDGIDLLALSESDLRRFRGKEIATIFQDPMTSLNPYLTIGEQLIEPLIYHTESSHTEHAHPNHAHTAASPHGNNQQRNEHEAHRGNKKPRRGTTRKDARIQAIALLDEVGIAEPDLRFDSYPHEFSGGMRQRVMIAMALIAKPRLLIADEPTTALDVTIQAQTLRLISELQTQRNLAVIFISHDLAVVSEIADKVAVMKNGQFVESGTTEEIFTRPQHPYTQALLAAVPTGKKPGPDKPGANPPGGTQPDTKVADVEKPYPSIVSESPLLEISHLMTWFHGPGNNAHETTVKAVDDVSLTIKHKEILGIVGESGSGKSTLGRSILQLVKTTGGSIKFAGDELTTLNARKMKPYRRRMQMIFQDPYASLNPRMNVFNALAEPLLYHGLSSRKTVLSSVLSLMDDVGLAASAMRKYPHEFSGGQRQRIAIGRAIATKPELIIADEPVSALDVTIQAQILELLIELVDKHNLTMLFISHDLSVVRYICDRIAVMHQGKLIESGDTETVWHHPQQLYTQSLLLAVPTVATHKK